MNVLPTYVRICTYVRRIDVAEMENGTRGWVIVTLELDTIRQKDLQEPKTQ